MKILYYSPHPDLSLHSPSGYGTHMREMIKAFREAGHEVTPCVMGDRPSAPAAASAGPRWRDRVKPLVPAYVWESMKDYRLLLRDKQYEEALVQEIERIQPDLVYERASFLQCSGVRAAGRLGVPHVLEMNAPYLEERRTFARGGSLFEQAARASEREQLKSTSRAVVVSEALKQYFIAEHGLEEDRFAIIPNAVDPDKIISRHENASAIRAKYDLQNRFVIGFVGSLFRWHGIDSLIEAFASLSGRFSGLALLIVGDGEIREELSTLTVKLGIVEHVRFTGNVPHDQVFDHIEAMDTCVHASSNWYGSPVKIFEYGAMKKPIIAPDNGPVRDVFVPGIDGLVVSSPDELASSLSWLIAHPEKASAFAAHFHAKVMSRHTWRHNVDRVLETLAEAVV